ncbi:MAG: pYEATS domain-containing protein, partial [Vicinamibacterales bacterium]
GAASAGQTARAGDLRAANTSRYLDNGRWSWSIFLQGPRDRLDQIRCVQYSLHKSLPNPVRQVCAMGDPRQPFKLDAEAWGTFEVGIRVTFKDGRTQDLRHTLLLQAPRSASPAVRLDNVSTKVRDGWWQWTVFVKGSEDALRRIRCVEYRLHPSFTNPVQRVCARGCGLRGFPLTTSGWGTFLIRARVELTDGNTIDLTHDLRFTMDGGKPVASLTLGPKRLGAFRLPGSREEGYVHVGDVSPGWPSRPFTVQVLAPGRPLSTGSSSSAPVDIDRLAAGLGPGRAWSASVTCAGDAFEFNWQGVACILTVERVNAGRREVQLRVWLK